MKSRATWSLGPLCSLVGCVTVIVAAAVSQKKLDDRDRIVLKNGHELRGRVLLRFGSEELTYLGKTGSRRRVARKKVQSVVTVNDHLRALFRQREQGASDPHTIWALCQWAESKRLHGMARILALDVILRDDNHRGAHEFLGHKMGRRGWRWRNGSTYRSRKSHDKFISDMGHPLSWSSEHFRVQSNAGSRQVVDTLMDLERLYLFWMDEFGKELQLREVLLPITLRVWATEKKFPAFTGRKEAYALTRNDGDYAATFYPANAKRPWRLFTVACQAMIERTLTRQQSDAGIAFDRICAWAEIGLAQWVASCMHGAPGHVVPGAPTLDRARLSKVLKVRPKLKNTTHLRYSLFLNPGRRASEHWDSTWAFIHFLMDPSQQPAYRDGFLEYVVAAFYGGKGDSSSALDQALGERVEKVQKRFYTWLAKNAR